MLKDATRRRFDVIMAWSVDRLGRGLLDLIGFLNEIHAYGVDLFLHQQSLDTTGPMGKAMFQIMGVFSELERAFIQQAWPAPRPQARRSDARRSMPPPSPASRRRWPRAAAACTRSRAACASAPPRCSAS